MNRTERLRCLAVVTTVLGMVPVACGDSGPKFGPPQKITLVGDVQTAVAGSAVGVDPAVVIQDAKGTGVPGLTVTFSVASGGGSVVGGTATTDGTGTATVTSWALGTTAGANSLTATAAGVPGSPVTFSAVAVAGPASTISAVGAPTSGPAGGNIDSLVVRVADQFGNPVAGETVAFVVTAGGGSVSPSSRVTLADGRAAARWTLGSTIGVVNTATATRTGLATPTVTFTATSTSPVASVRFTNRLLVVDSAGTVTPALAAFDQAGNAIANAPISVTTRSPSIATAGTSTVTGVRSGQTFLVATSVDNAAARDSALVIVGSIGAPVVTASVPRFDLKTDTTFTVSIVVDMRTSTEKLGAATLQVTWDPSVISFVSQTEGAANAQATLNTSGTGTGVLTMAMASSSGFSGVIELRKITFTAATTAGRTGALAVNVIDLGAAVTFTNLAPKTVSGTYPLRTR